MVSRDSYYKPQDPEFALDEALQICNDGRQTSLYLPANAIKTTLHIGDTL